MLACGWGVFGVAIGTVVSQAFSWLYGLWYINRRYPQIAIRPFCRRFDRSLFGQIMGIGLPAGIQMSLVALGAMVVMSKINTFGKEFTAGYNVGYRLDQLAFLPVQSLSNAVTAFVGAEHRRPAAGPCPAGHPGDGGLLRGVVAADGGGPDPPSGRTQVGLFSDTPAVIDAGAVYLRCIMPFYAIFAVMFSLNNAMRGAGESMFPMLDAIFFPDSAAGPRSVLAGQPLRLFLYVLWHRHRLDAGVHAVRPLLSLRAVEAPRVPGGPGPAGPGRTGRRGLNFI